LVLLFLSVGRDEEVPEGFVRLPGGWLVREQITRRFRNRDHPDDRYELTVRVSASGFAVEQFAADPPVPPERLRELDLPGMVERAVLDAVEISLVDPPEYIDALRERLGRPADFDEDRFGSWHEAAIAIREEMAATSVRKIRRRRKITPELLEQVRDLYDRGGIGAVVDGLDMSPRNAWRLLARAREELPDE
jgi:hypothetical protein